MGEPVVAQQLTGHLGNLWGERPGELVHDRQVPDDILVVQPARRRQRSSEGTLAHHDGAGNNRGGNPPRPQTWQWLRRADPPVPTKARYRDEGQHHQNGPEPELLLQPKDGPQRKGPEFKRETRNGSDGNVFRPVAPRPDRGPRQ